MARRRTSTAIVRAIPVRAPAPIIRVQAPRASGGGKKKRHRRSSSGGLSQKSMLGSALGGAVYGFVEKTFGAQLPTVPVLGRAGTVAVICHFLGKGRSHGIVRDVGLAAAVIAGYQLGALGKIQGDIMGAVVPQVSGVAAQV